MRVQNINSNKSVNIENNFTKTKTDFSQSFDSMNKSKTKQELDDYMKEIKKCGERLIRTQNYSDISMYKKAIKGYLKSVVDYAYSINKNTSFWEGNYFTTVKTVNEKLEQMTRELIYEQKENLDIASKVEEINGLLLDVYL